ncbi:CsbD family protein [Brachybacterium huguangmaarense]
MNTQDKFENKAEELSGRTKEAIGDATDDHSLEAEGESEKASAGLKQAGENLKDAAKNVKDTLTGK